MQYCRYNLQYGGLILSCHSHNLHGILKKDSTYSFERSSRKFTWNLSELITFYFTPKNIRKASVFWYLQSGIKANQFAWIHLNLKQNLETITTIYPLNTSSISGKPSKRFSKLSKIEWKKLVPFFFWQRYCVLVLQIIYHQRLPPLQNDIFSKCFIWGTG